MLVSMNKLLFIIAIAGLLVSGYLWSTHAAPEALICGENGGCHTVQESIYSEHFGIPTAAYGVAYYAFLASLALISSSKKNPPRLTWVLYLTTASGLVVSTYLTYLEAFVIDAWCRWCVASAIIATLAFAIVWLQPKKELHS